MNTCNDCGKKVEDGILFCTKCGAKINQPVKKSIKASKQKSNKVPIICILCAIIVLGTILGKDSIMYNYYRVKGNKESSISQSINYYTKALKLKYEQDLIVKISEKIKKDQNFETTLENLDWIVKEEDLNKIYVNAYVSKAKEQFESKNYKITWNYLEKASLYDYDIEKFEYYKDLVKLEEKEEALEANQDKNTSELQPDYIIADSDTRYLTIEELSGYTKRQLAFIRNEIFARYGYIFENEEYNDYFMSMPWYNPNSNFVGSESNLNAVERANLKIIKTLEQE